MGKPTHPLLRAMRLEKLAEASRKRIAHLKEKHDRLTLELDCLPVAIEDERHTLSALELAAEQARKDANK